jgi:dTDP-4-dehydrorhamnose reductase
MQIPLFGRNGQAGWKLRVVDDQAGNPAWYPEVTAEILTRLSKEEGSSLSVEMERYKVVPITPAEYPRAAKHPQYSVLSKVKIRRAFGLTIATWSEQWDDCLQTLESHNEGNDRILFLSLSPLTQKEQKCLNELSVS